MGGFCFLKYKKSFVLTKYKNYSRGKYFSFIFQAWAKKMQDSVPRNIKKLSFEKI